MMEKNNKQQENTEKMAVKKNADTADNKLRTSSKSLLVWLAIAVLVCALAGLAWFMQQQLQNQQRETTALATRLASTEQVATQLSQLKQTMTQNSTTTQQRLGELNAADATLAEKLDELTKTQQLTNGDVLRTWALAEVTFLLNTANQSLLLAENVDQAETALTLADQQIRSLADPRLYPLRELLADEQLALASVTKVDVAGLAMELQSALDKVDSLQVLIGPARSAEDNKTDESAVTSSLPDSVQMAASAAWQQVKSLVVIRHQQDANAALLIPEQRYFLYQNLRLKLESARLALLSDNEAVFHDSLASAEQWLQQYFVGDERDAVIEMLTAMQLETITVELPDISASLIWLQKNGDQ